MPEHRFTETEACFQATIYAFTVTKVPLHSRGEGFPVPEGRFYHRIYAPAVTKAVKYGGGNELPFLNQGFGAGGYRFR